MPTMHTLMSIYHPELEFAWSAPSLKRGIRWSFVSVTFHNAECEEGSAESTVKEGQLKKEVNSWKEILERSFGGEYYDDRRLMFEAFTGFERPNSWSGNQNVPSFKNLLVAVKKNPTRRTSARGR
jgi:hypothetical protein